MFYFIAFFLHKETSFLIAIENDLIKRRKRDKDSIII